MSTATRIALDQLRPAPFNKRDAASYGKTPLTDLAASIKAKDVLSPIMVRLTEGHYQIIAGHRRAAAAKLAGLTDVPCTVMNVSEDEAREICTIENLQREDLSLMEEAAQILALNGAGKQSVAEIAAKIGKSPHFVALRVRLATNITPAVMKYMTKHGWPTAWWEQMARLDKAAQDEIIKEHHINDADQLRKVINGYLMELKLAKWSLDDIELLPEAGACSACPKRSSAQSELFADLSPTKNDRCTDNACWKKKQLAHNTRILMEARKVHGDEIIPITHEYIPHDEQNKPWAKDGTMVTRIGSYTGLVVAKKTTPGAKPAIDVKTGAITYVADEKAVRAEQSGKKHKGKAPTAKKVKTNKEKYQALTQRRYFAICKEILLRGRTTYSSKPDAKSPFCPGLPKEYGIKEVCDLLNATTPSLRSGSDSSAAAKAGIKPTQSPQLAEHLFECGRNDIITSCFHNRLVSDVKVEIIQANIEWFKMDSAKLQAWAITEVPTPKSLKEYEAQLAK